MKQIVDELGTRWTLDETERLQHAVSNNDVEIAKKYLEQGANPNGSNQYDLTPLMITALNGNLEMAKLLISKGADVNVKDKNGNTALAYCSNYGYIIVAKNADVNVKDKYGYIKIAKFFVENGADINHRNKDGITALEQAIKNSNFELAKFLIENGADHKSINKSLVIVCEQSDGWGIKPNKKEKEEFLHYLISHNEDVNAKNCIGVSALGNAVLVDNLEIAKYLIENGATINITNNFNETALMQSARNGNLEMTKLLISKGAEINPRGYDGTHSTPLMIATMNNQVKVAKLLIEKGANTKAQYKDGRTFLDFADDKSKKQLKYFLFQTKNKEKTLNKKQTLKLECSNLL